MGYYAKRKYNWMVYPLLMIYMLWAVAAIIVFKWFGVITVVAVSVGFYYWAGEYHVKR